MNHSSKFPDTRGPVNPAQCVLLLHGLGASSLEVAKLAKSLHEAGFVVRTPDIEGFGFGTPCTNWRAWIDTVKNLIWEYRAQYQTVSLVGLSMGATLALAAAAEEELDAVVLLAPAMAYDGWAMPWYGFMIGMAPFLPFVRRYCYVEREPFGVKNEEMRATIKRALQRDHISVMGADALSLTQVSQGRKLVKYVRSVVSQIESPTLIMHAVEDETVCIRNAEWIYQHIGSTSRDIIYLGDSYHMITIDNDREIVFQETQRFLKNTINKALGAPVFEVPGIHTPALRRLLRKQN